ncbi:leucyl aminopeptidase [Candidatus Uabimicrobium sp. HlEnr_7]|uniref:leucyl aminopeptidase n=1 Tax=Candidatus Uabimicrobium helgolandensis TaxID=3095367 RepID=UPI003558B269
MHTIKITYGKERIKNDVLIVDYFEDQPIDYGERFADNDPFYEIAKPAFESKDFAGKWKQTIILYASGKLPEKRVMLIGLGERSDVYPFKIKVSLAHALKKMNSFHELKTVSVFINKEYDSDKVKEIATFLVEAAYMSQYQAKNYKKDQKLFSPIEHLHLVISDNADEKDIEEAIHQGKIIGQGINEVRDLINKPSSEVTPSYLANYTLDLASKNEQIECKIFHRDQLKQMGMNGIVSVGQGSNEEPKLIMCTYTPEVEAQYSIALVGKGVTFDSGGISLKPSNNMYLMKIDMAGAALVIVLMKVIALLKLPVKVYGLVPTCENMPDGNALKPGDIITAYDGTSVEVIDTDAEGRLILMDALGYAVTQKPNMIVDIATLTGACTVALGRYVIGGMSNHDPIMDIMRASGDYMYERVWELPLMEEYKLMLQSNFADIKNFGGKEAGAITAGAFLSHFVDEVPWIHLDIAGVSWFNTETSLMPHGATGIGIRLITDFMRRILKEDGKIWENKTVDIRQTLYKENEVPKYDD